MATIDDKVVAMSFESSKFESGVSKTISALDKLKASLSFPNAGKGLDDLNAAGKRVDLGHISKAVDEIRQKLGFLSVAALAVFAQMAQKAAAAGATLIKSLTIDPVIAGLHEYETNLNAVQTILANTAAAGTNLKQVNKALLELNQYSDKTIYNFSEMAKNIGTFTAAGVDLKTSTAAIKGIANLAALSGSNSQQAATAMYQLSQAISAGRVSLQDWNSVVNAGMGGTVFQRALAQTAVTMGKLPASALKLVGPMKNVSIHGESFRQSISAAPGKQSWLTSDVLTSTLKQFTSDMTDAELASMGFNREQIKAIQAQALMAMRAATQVKTLSQVLEVAKETAGSGWAQTWQIIFGDFGEAKKTFTDLSNSINAFINTSAEARNKVLGDWKALGGRTVMIDSIRLTFENLGKILAPIKEAFRDIFPAKTGMDLYSLTTGFYHFADALKPSAETVKNLHRTFAGFFAALDIGKQVMSGVFSVFARLFGVIFDGAGSFLDITANIGDFLVAVDLALKKGTGLDAFFQGIGDILVVPLELLDKLAEALANLFDGFSPGGFSVQIDGITKATEPFKKSIEVISQGLEGLGPAINSAISHMNFDAILAVINTGLFAGLVLLIKRFFGGTTFAKAIGGIGGGIFENLSGAFGSLTGSLKAMQQNLKAKTLKELAIAIALLSASVVALSFVDPKRLNSALSAMTLAFTELLGAMIIMDKVTSSKAFIKLPFIAGSLILLAAAIDLLAISVIVLSRLSWEELTKGLGGIVVLLGALVAASGPLGKNAPGMIRAGIALGTIAVALNILALAVKQLGSMDLASLSKGLGGIAGALGILVVAMKSMPTGMIMQSAALVVIATALNILASAVNKFGSMNLFTLGKGLLGIGAGLVIIAGAMKLMPMSMVVTSGGLLLVAASLGKITEAVKSMGGMSIRDLATGLVGLAGSLTILAVALHVMSGTLAGAAALTVAAAGLALLAPALVSLGRQSWSSILKSMVALGAALGVIAGAALLLSPAVPALLGFGAALIVVGAGLTLAGAGIALIGVGLSAIAVSGTTSIGILIQALIDFSEALPKFVKNLVLGLLAIVEELARTAPQFVKALVVILDGLLNVVIQSSPKIAQAFGVLIVQILKVLVDNAPKIIQAGFELLMALLRGIQANIVQVTTMAVKVIATFLGALASKIGSIISAGADLIIGIVRGITNNIGKLLGAGLSIIVKLVSGIASNVGKVISAGASIILNFVTGLGSNEAKIVAAGVSAIIKFIGALSSNAVRLADAGASAVINFLNGIARVIENREPEMIAAGANIGAAIVKGLIKGLVAWAPAAYEKAKDIGERVIRALGDAVKFWSPSRSAMEIGQGIIDGLSLGLDANASNLYNSATVIGNGVIGAFNDVLQTRSPSKVMIEIGKYVGQGFAKGLTSSQDDIRAAFTALNDKLTQAMTTARETIASEQAKLKELRDADKPDAKAIAEAQRVINQNEAILRRSAEAHKLLTSGLKAQKIELLGLAAEYETVGQKLSAAQDILAEAIQTRDQAISGYTEQYSALPEIDTSDTEGDALATYKAALESQITAVQKYSETLQKLRALGLDDATYQKLLEEGPVDQQFADQLLAGGPAAIAGLNALDAQLESVSKGLATNAATNLYQAGVNAAQGIVDGLASRQSELAKEMKKLAKAMIKALKRELGIKSPSEEFAKLGAFSMLGMAKGFSKSTKLVTQSIKQVSDDALAALEKSMNNVSNIVSGKIDANPTISPILDLTQVQNESKRLASLMAATPITAKVSLEKASTISTEQSAADDLLRTAEKASSGTLVKFEQNNYSPTALTEIEIYRQTKNQLSKFKSALALP